MKTIVKKIFKGLGYEIMRVPESSKLKGDGRVQHNIEFIHDEKF
ncbi:hypothetical protein [Halomonas sp.]